MIDDRLTGNLADVYVLGLLEASEAAEVERRMDGDADLAAAVGASRDRFLELDLAVPPAVARPAMWEAIERRIAEPGQGDGALSSAAPQAAAAGDGGDRKRSWGNANDNAAVRRWRAVSLAAIAASVIVVAGASALVWMTPEPQPQVVAILAGASGEPLAVLEDFGDSRARLTPLTMFDVPNGRTMQVWTLPSKERGPVSLGLLGQSVRQTLSGPALPPPHVDQLYEITLEPAGGSPTGRPTGPILVKGLARAAL